MLGRSVQCVSLNDLWVRDWPNWSNLMMESWHEVGLWMQYLDVRERAYDVKAFLEFHTVDSPEKPAITGVLTWVRQLLFFRMSFVGREWLLSDYKLMSFNGHLQVYRHFFTFERVVLGSCPTRGHGQVILLSRPRSCAPFEVLERIMDMLSSEISPIFLWMDRLCRTSIS